MLTFYDFGPSLTDPHWLNVSFLHGWTNLDGSYATFSSSERIEESSNAQASTAFSGAANINIEAGGKFGDCLGVDTAAANVQYADSTLYALGSGAFTLETWVRFDVAPSSSVHYLFGQYDTGANQRSWALLINAGSLQMALSTAGTSATIVASAGWAPSTGVWYHVVGEFDGSAYRTYVNGVMNGKSTTLVTPLHNSTAPFTVGAVLNSGAGNGAFRGQLDEIRITKGVARYASDSGYVTPTTAFPRG